MSGGPYMEGKARQPSQLEVLTNDLATVNATLQGEIVRAERILYGVAGVDTPPVPQGAEKDPEPIGQLGYLRRQINLTGELAQRLYSVLIDLSGQIGGLD